MTAEEFKAKRRTIWKTQARAAAAIGVTIQAVRYWEQGRRKVSTPVVKLIECLEDKQGK